MNGEPKKKKGGNYAKANDVPALEVATWLGLIDEFGNVTCPGCKTVNDGVAIVDGGLKCQHDRCATKGKPGGKKGFRTNIDLVAEVKNVKASEALRLIAE